MKNEDLRQYAANNNVRLWQVAEKFGVTDASFSRKLRKEFTTENARRFMQFVDEVVNESNK